MFMSLLELPQSSYIQTLGGSNLMERGVHFAELPQKIIAVLPLRLPLNATFKQMKTQFVDIMFSRLPPKHYSPASLPLQSN